MDIRQEIAKQVEELPPRLQEQVLRFVVSLTASTPTGEKGAALHQFSSSLDSISVQEIREAIERGCEQVDSTQW